MSFPSLQKLLQDNGVDAEVLGFLNGEPFKITEVPHLANYFEDRRELKAKFLDVKDITDGDKRSNVCDAWREATIMVERKFKRTSVLSYCAAR